MHPIPLGHGRVSVELRVALDKNEGVVKAHLWCAVFFAPRHCQRG